jgi:hypothetical protein
LTLINDAFAGLTFDRGKPFHPLVIGYALHIIGFNEMAIQGLAGVERRFTINTGSAPEEEAARLREHFADLSTKVTGSPDLRSLAGLPRVAVDRGAIIREVAYNIDKYMPMLLPAAGALLVTAHEYARDKPFNDRGPLWEFLRHCRNAVAHRGCFSLRPHEPTRPAIWRNKEISQALDGKPLFDDGTGGGLLGPADPVYLLHDLETGYPSIT